MWKYHCTIDLLFDWFGISCMTTVNCCFYLQNRLFQTSQTGGQQHSDTSPFSIPWLHHCRPFMRLDGANEVERLDGWEDLEPGDFYSQGNWKDLNEFFEYCTEWEPTNSLYFGGECRIKVLN